VSTLAESPVTVRAAGCAVWRSRDDDGVLETAVVHRPKYDDWSLPKGKLEDDESFETGALREVEEETGMRCRLGDELEPSNYQDRKGRDKVVRYWLMEPVDDTDFVPNDEVDQLRWLAPPEALELLSYPHDRELVQSAAERLG
jgi:8-oxo-dGTP diphosphatase